MLHSRAATSHVKRQPGFQVSQQSGLTAKDSYRASWKQVFSAQEQNSPTEDVCTVQGASSSPAAWAPQGVKTSTPAETGA